MRRNTSAGLKGAYCKKTPPVPPAAHAPPARILIVRLSALGDLVFATSLLDGLKQAWPAAEVDWLVQPEFADFLRSQPAIARVHCWDRKAWAGLWRGRRYRELWRTIVAFRRELRARDYDWVIDAQGLAKSRLLAWLAGGRRRIGYTSKEPLGFLMHEGVARPVESRPYAGKRIAGEHRALVEYLSGVPGAAPRLAPLPREGGGEYLVLAPFTTRPQKHWPERHWAELLRQLVARGERPQLLGGPADRAAAERILRASGVAAQVDDQVGRTRLPEAAAAIAGARAVIGVDTGLTHMGVACDRPTVAIFGSTVPYRGGARAPLEVLWLGLDCSPCKRKPTCGGAYTCLVDIGPAQVLAALDRVLAA